MQTRNKIFDDLSELMTNALGVAQGAKDEADTAIRGVIDRWLADKDLVSREELEVLKIMSEKLSKENADLKSRIEILEKQNSKTSLSFSKTFKFLWITIEKIFTMVRFFTQYMA